MHILIVPSWYPTEKKPIDGSFFKEQALALQKAGNKVTVAYVDIRSIKSIVLNPIENKGYISGLESSLYTYRYNLYNYIPKVNIGFNYIVFKKLDYIFNKVIEERGMPDVIHLHSFLKSGYAAMKISDKYKVPYIYTEHYSGFSKKILTDSQKKMVRKTASLASKVTVVGQGLKENLQNIIKDDITIIPNMVDINKFNIIQNEDNNKTKFIFFCLGNLLEVKGIDILLKSFSEIKHKNIKLYIGGKGEEEKNLKKLVKDLNIEKRVVFLGEISRKDVNKYMNICDVFVLPSRHETFGVVFIEALATGTPVIASDCEGPKGIVTDENGIIIPKENVEKLTGAMEYMIENINQYNKQKIREDCIKRFGTKAITNKYIEIYKDILNQK